MGIIRSRHGWYAVTDAPARLRAARCGRSSYRSRIAGSIAVIGLLLGCTASDNGLSSLSDLNSQRMLQVGLSDIQQIYIDEPVVSDLAVAGLKGLRRIEPDFDVERQNDRLKISYRNSEAGYVMAPRSNDAYAWASTVSQLLNDGRKLSGRLSEARSEEIYTALFDSLASKLDPYSRYSGAGEARENRASRDGFGGIGVTIVPHDDGVEITNVAAGLPAEKAGLKTGQTIVAVDGQGASGLALQDVALMLQGPVRETVDVVVRSKNGEESEVTVTRTHITPQTVFYRRDGDYAVIELTSFNSDTSASMAQAIYRARTDMDDAMKGIVLDLRNNPGGLLHQAVRVADLFIESGRIISTRGRHRDSLQVFDATPGDIAEGTPIAVLLNGYSASAAEILAAALQDRGRAVIIGSTSYGKGTVQTVLRMPNDGELILTWARLHAPSGYAMHGLGVVPMICTTGDAKAHELVAAAQQDKAPWRRMLAIRRNYAKSSKQERKLVDDYCRSDTEGLDAIDLEVAKNLLGVQKGYMQTIQIARSANGL